jgi:2-polyprenyl-3-methyl-5-hydroxy-6-metoxy-1,4-benzoquinol methylase
VTARHARRLLAALDPLFQSRAMQRLVTAAVRQWASSVSRLAPEDSLRRLLGLYDNLYGRIDLLAIELDGGIHAKHRLTGYHDFFVDRVQAGEAVLDVGCGKGELAHDLAVRSRARVTGVDRNPASLAFAEAHFRAPGLSFVESDIYDWEPSHAFDVVVLSNVLEHLSDRVGLLRRLVAECIPKRVLIRVPSVERDWTVPLREQLGMAYFSDPTHETEYTAGQLESELSDAGLRIEELLQRWGELWAVAVPEAAGIVGAS